MGEISHVSDKSAEQDQSSGARAPFTLADATAADVKATKPPDTGNLHTVAIHDSAAPQAAGDDHGSGAAPTHEWTVAYYLGATKTMPGEGKPGQPPPPNTDWGSAHKAEQLKEMAAATAGTGVTVLVDSLREKEDVKAARQKLVDEGKLDSDHLASHDPKDYVVDHLRLKDGQVEDLGSSPSKGLTEDVKDLVSHASHDDPAKKLGLVINADGGGNRGVMGDSSPIASNAKLQAAIKDGLAGSGKDHDRLDVLDMDACVMSQTGALRDLGGAAKDIVASAETERSAVDRVDGQNLQSGLRHLLDHPEMSGKDWSDKIVSDASSGANDTKHDGPPTRFDTGTATLAHIDGDKTQPLADAVDHLGDVLRAAAADPAAKGTIDGIIEKLPRFAADGSPTDSYGEQKRDLKGFSQALQKAVADGSLKDPDGKLASALTAVDQAERQAVISYSGTHDGGYDKEGGVSLYLPDLTFRDLDKTLAQATPLAQAADVLSRFSQLPRPTEGPPDVVNGKATSTSAQLYVGSYLKTLDPQQRQAAAPLVEAMQQLGRADTYEGRQAALQHATDVARQMLNSDLQHDLVASADHQAAAARRQVKVDRELSGDVPGWRGFVEAMGWS